MLPPAPKDVGRLSQVFSSALSAIGGRAENQLRLPRANHSIVIVIDGLGYQNLIDAKGHSRFLNSHLSESIRCEFPSTTANSLAGLATGTRSSVHGVIGYSVYDRASNCIQNLLTGWGSAGDVDSFKKAKTISESTKDQAVRFISDSNYEHSGFTQLTMAGAEFLPAASIEERLEQALDLPNTPSLSYVYIPELDQLGHKFGIKSRQWLEKLEELDSFMSKFVARIPEGVGVLLTADHGVIDVPQVNQVLLDRIAGYSAAVSHTTGDPRCNFIYLNDPAGASEFRELLVQQFGSELYICNPLELKEAGWADWTASNLQSYVPDLVLIWKSVSVGYDSRFAKPSHLRMIGQHGGISDVETRVPLIRFGEF